LKRLEFAGSTCILVLVFICWLILMK
jgi:hypothetical protein